MGNERKSTGNYYERSLVHLLVAVSGLATLSWEVIWQIKSSLALGVSAQGTAITLTVTMGGMGCGSLLMGHVLARRFSAYPIRVYGALEFIIGVSGLLLGVAFAGIEQLDSYFYSINPQSAPALHIAAIIAALGIPAICMGATLPVFGLIARQAGTTLSTLYALNTLGAAAGVLAAAFIFIPAFGIEKTGCLIAACNFLVTAVTWLWPTRATAPKPREDSQSVSVFVQLLAIVSRPLTRFLGKVGSAGLSLAEQVLVVTATGFATLSLEVAWFRSITAAFQNTTCAFAVMLASLLAALGQAARDAPAIKQRKIPLGSILCWAGILILVMTPVVERFDLLLNWNNHVEHAGAGNGSLAVPMQRAGYDVFYLLVSFANLFLLSYMGIGLPMLFLGAGFPWVLDDQAAPGRWAKLYALNTFAAIAGSISAAWFFLPAIGFARTAWLDGALVAVTGIAIAPGVRRRSVLGVFATAALIIAIAGESGVGRIRALGSEYFSSNGKPSQLIEFYEGPDSTVSVSGEADGRRILIIDGASASGQSGGTALAGAHYLEWMGALPMLGHPDPKDVLVICFGTGQTANAVRKENPQSLDIVDINKNVFKLAHNFPANENVLGDPRTSAIVMDGRAYLRRTTKMYDVITLEPMPPNLAGVNALYSHEFYELARARLNADGVIAQWLPFNTSSLYYAASIARTFQEIFPNSILWIDPATPVGILVGSKNSDMDLNQWPGFARVHHKRGLTEQQVRDGVMLDRTKLLQYGAYGTVISDDNQLLAYGKNAQSIYVNGHYVDENMNIVKKIAESR